MKGKRSAPLLLATVGLAAVLGCTADHSGFETLAPTQLDALLSAARAVAVDANGAGTRRDFGVVPGAVLLTHYQSYDLAELPADKARRLVFYCANPRCSAAPAAAQKARAAGYLDVAVMTAGIQGWVDAGLAVTPHGQG